MQSCMIVEKQSDSSNKMRLNLDKKTMGMTMALVAVRNMTVFVALQEQHLHCCHILENLLQQQKKMNKW